MSESREINEFRQTTYKISKALDLIGRNMFGDRWAGNEVDTDRNDDPDGHGRLKAARRALRAALYHGHVQSWTVTSLGERQVIPPGAWEPGRNLFAGCFIDAGRRAQTGMGVDDAWSLIDGLLAPPNPREIRLRDIVDDLAGAAKARRPRTRRPCVPVYVDRAALETRLTAPAPDDTHAPDSQGAGRRLGDGSYDRTDDTLIDEMHALLTGGQARSILEAAKNLADRAEGAGTRASAVGRLRRKYRRKYPRTPR